MKIDPSITIAGESFGDLVDSLAEWSVTQFESGNVRVVVENGREAFAPWARAIARRVDELTAAGIAVDLAGRHAMALQGILQEMTAILDAADATP